MTISQQRIITSQQRVIISQQQAITNQQQIIKNQQQIIMKLQQRIIHQQVLQIMEVQPLVILIKQMLYQKVHQRQLIMMLLQQIQCIR